jgi:DNA polymerase III gamma/tau subunit
MILDVAKNEGFELDAGSTELMAILGDGSYRDTQGILQKVLNFSFGRKPTGETKTKKIKKEDVEKITGAPKTTLVNEFLSAIINKNIEEGIKTIGKASLENLDMKLYLKLIIQKFRMAIILRYAPKLEKEMDIGLSITDIEFLKELIKTDKEGLLRSLALSILLDAYQNIDRAFISELPLELALIKIISENSKVL